MNYHIITKKGFTVIELVVTIAIVGILSSVIIASLNSSHKKSRDARRRIELNQLSASLELYYSKYGIYPISTSNCGGQSSDSWCRDSQGSNWIPGLNEFMTMPHNPTPLAASGWVYHYYGLDGTKYWLMTKLENVANDTCGGGAIYIWLDNSGDWCNFDPSNNYAVYVVSQR